MNKNDNKIKSTFSNIRPSEECIERIEAMTNNNSKKHFKPTPAIAAALCVLLLVTGIFGGGALSGRIGLLSSKDNIFTITAYAKDGDKEKQIDLEKTPVAKTSLRLNGIKLKNEEGTGELGGCDIASTPFKISGKNISAVSYSAKRGSFDYQSLNGNDFEAKTTQATPYDSNYPYASVLNATLGNSEELDVFYLPQEAIDLICKADSTAYDYASLPSDTITISVTFADGTTAEKTIVTSFDSDGYMLIEYR